MRPAAIAKRRKRSSKGSRTARAPLVTRKEKPKIEA